MARRRRHSIWAFAAAIGFAFVTHAGSGVVYQFTRPIPKPRLMVDVVGDGGGIIHSAPGGITCGDDCREDVEVGTVVTLRAIVGEGSTFAGFDGPCGDQSHRWFRWAQAVLLYGKTYDDVSEDMDLYDYLGEYSSTSPPADPLECVVVVDRDVRIGVSFGVQPDEVEVEWIALEDEPDQPEIERADAMVVALPDPSYEAENAVTPPPIEVPDEMEIDQPEPEKPPEIAAIVPPKPVIPQPTPPPPKQTPAAPKKEIEVPKLKSVEVPDKNEVDKAPDDAQFLSDKNRNVAEETHAKQTNLEKQAEGEREFSEKSEIKSEDIGAEEPDIAQMEETEASDIDVERETETAHTGKDEKAEGVRVGELGESGEEGESGDGRDSKNPGIMAMRGIEGKGAPGGPVEVAEKVIEEGPGATGEIGDGGKQGRRGTRGRRGVKTQLEFEDYKRIVGNDVADEEVKVAKRTQSKRRGRWEKKLGAIKSSLENFTPEVKPGNQTALKTRAAPFAVYIARMHRRIHELWGFGFLEDLDDKSSSHEMNDWTLWTTIEVVVNPDGTIDKLTIVKPSGVLTFDVAALDVVYTGGPYEPPPEKIRSPDGKAYMHWSFHRDWRQCGTFGVQPFILDSPPKADDRDKGLDDTKLVSRVPKRNRGKNKKAAGDEIPMPKGKAAPEEAAAATARATANMPTPDDPKAQHAVNLWLTGFTKNDAAKMLKVTGAPFRSGESVVANKVADVKSIYNTILDETKDRIPRKTRLLSAAGYRKSFGSLPAGVEVSGSELFYVVRLKKEQFTLMLQQQKDGDYKVVGFYR